MCSPYCHRTVFTSSPFTSCNYITQSHVFNVPPIYTLSLFSQYCKYCKFHRAINFVVDLMVVYFDSDSFHHTLPGLEKSRRFF
jgi:hypothetical protein